MGSEVEGKRRATEFRGKYHLGDHPLGDLITLVEQTIQCDVAILDATGQDEHGLSMRDPDRGVVFIGIARTRNPMRQRSTLAHELAHVLFGDWDGPQGDELSIRNPQEIRADAFSRHLLVPEAGVETFIGADRNLDETDLSNVVQRFLVSPAMAAITLYNCGYISEAQKSEWMTLSTARIASRHGWIDQYESMQRESVRTRPPQRLLARAIIGYEEGVLSAQAIATLRGIPLDAAERYLSNIE
jgi:Zn-dependent peptidase ImmA (M78 family)